MMNSTTWVWRIAVVFSACAATAAVWAQTPESPAQNPWAQPAAELANKIAEILGPGQARLAIRNQSSIPPDEIPTIRRLLEQDLKVHGVQASGAESANTIRVTLSENLRERLWVAEVIEGSETRVVMVPVEAGPRLSTQSDKQVTLRKQAILVSKSPVLALLETGTGYVVVEPEEIVLYAKTANGAVERKHATIAQRRPLARDPRSFVWPTADGQGFEATLAGLKCSGDFSLTVPGGSWPVECRESDDPWLLTPGPATQKVETPRPADTGTAFATNGSTKDASGVFIRAFYNSARNYFTGVVTPGFGVDLPPFYSAALVARTAGFTPMVAGIDGKVQLVENGTLKTVSGTRDWGSDIAAFATGCGSGSLVVATASGEAVNDSLRAYELPALEAVPASAAVTMNGTVTAMWTALDSMSALAVVRRPTGDYEVDSVTALCD